MMHMVVGDSSHPQWQLCISFALSLAVLQQPHSFFPLSPMKLLFLLALTLTVCTVAVQGHKQQQCSEKELLALGGRLLKWFTDMHRVNGGMDKSLPDHKVTCRADVAWMFEQWDGDNDGKLSKTELLPLIGGGGEKCTGELIDKCDDMIVDDEISIDEWCDCFVYSDDLRHEPPCHKQKHSTDPHMPGVYLPRCDLEGFYRPEQCHNGDCWCVDKYGREFDNSRIAGKIPDCGQYSVMSKEVEAELKARL